MKTYLTCTHCYNRKSKKEYLIECEVIKKMPDQERCKIKLLGEGVYGKRKNNIRYVQKERIITQ